MPSAILLTAALAAAAVSMQSGSEPPQTIATVNGQPILESDLRAATAGEMLRLRQEEYQVKRRAAEQLVRDRLVDAVAAKQGLSREEFLKREVDAKVAEPTDGEAEAFYLGQRDKLGSRVFADIKPQLVNVLKIARVRKAREDFAESLRKDAKIVWLLDPPRTQVDPDPARLRGDAGAPVTIIEFSDFECPYCSRVQATIQQLMAKYAGSVKLSFRDFPLAELHPGARKAAEAARCAGQQGKFWEYHDALFANRGKVDAPALEARARTLGLNVSDFTACLSSGRFQADIDRDIQAGSAAGVSGTPGFFVNGVFLNGAVPFATFEKIIDEELARLRARSGRN